MRIYIILWMIALPFMAMAQGIHFEKGTFDEALGKAKAENKLLFVDGYAVWCSPCLAMANTVFKDEEVGKYFDEYLVAIKVDVEKGEGPAISKRYGIVGLPGYVFIDGDGLVVYRFSSSMPAADFMREVKLAVSYADDPNSVGRLGERYKVEKSDTALVKLYLDKLKESKSTGYTNVLEHYLSVQTTMADSSKEMVVFLADHYREIILGGEAERITRDNYGSDAWKLYVRKDIREVYQRLEHGIVENTIRYATENRDTVMLELALQREEEINAGKGMKTNPSQRRRVYARYYLETNMGEKYKALVRDENEAFINQLNAEELRSGYLDWQKRKAAGEEKAQYTRPHSIRTSLQIQNMVKNYGRFVTTGQEKQDVLRWAKRGYDIIPGDPAMMSVYADLLYLFDNREAGLKEKEEAFRIASERQYEGRWKIEQNLELMRKGEHISL
ncbi:MAG: thioredoxin family protein [Bacteroidota bacterium]